MDKYLGLARELKRKQQKKQKTKKKQTNKTKKQQWNLRLTVLPIVAGVLETVPKDLERGLDLSKIRGRIQTIQTTALLRSVRIPRRVLETWGDLLSFRPVKKPSYHWGAKIHKKIIIMIIIIETHKILRFSDRLYHRHIHEYAKCTWDVHYIYT